MNRLVLLFPAVLAVAACGTQTEEDLITDADLNAIVSSREGLASTPVVTPPEAGAVHVRLAWGYLAGRRNAPGWINWTGGVGVANGTVELENLNYFDRHDRPVPTQDTSKVGWVSRTLPHFDGVVVKVTPGAAGEVLKFATPPYEREISLADLAAGVNDRVVVDAEGHEVSISSVPDQGCGGFSFGYEKASNDGWLGFAGLFTDASGQVTGRLRFKAEGEAITARVIKSNGDHPYDLNPSGDVSATGEGHLDTATGRFEISLTGADGAPAGQVKGQFTDESYAPRGAYQAVVSCP